MVPARLRKFAIYLSLALTLPLCFTVIGCQANDSRLQASARDQPRLNTDSRFIRKKTEKRALFSASSKKEIKKVQTFLNDTENNNLNVDGVYGQATTKGVIKWCEKNHYDPYSELCEKALIDEANFNTWNNNETFSAGVSATSQKHLPTRSAVLPSLPKNSVYYLRKNGTKNYTTRAFFDVLLYADEEEREWVYFSPGKKTIHYLRISDHPRLREYFPQDKWRQAKSKGSHKQREKSRQWQTNSDTFDVDEAEDTNEPRIQPPLKQAKQQYYYLSLPKSEVENYSNIRDFERRRDRVIARFARRKILLKSNFGKSCHWEISFPQNARNQLTPHEPKPKCYVVQSDYKLDPETQIAGCADIRKRGRDFVCVQNFNDKKSTIFTRYPGWKSWYLEPGARLQDVYFTPEWPFTSDPWLDATKESNHPCSLNPFYRATSVKYSSNKITREKKFTRHSRQNGEFELPSLKRINWPPRASLPSKISVKFSRSSPGNSFPKRKTVTWALKENEPLPSDLRSAMGIEIPKKQLLPVKIDDDLLLQDPRAKFMLFDGLEACKTGEKTEKANWRPYHKDDLLGLSAHKCSFAKVRRGDRDLSNCAQPKKIGKNWVYRLAGSQFEGKRIVVLIADSRVFDNVMGIEIRRSLIDWLENIKKQNLKAPISVLTVEGDGRIRSVIRAEDLYNTDNIRARIKKRLKFNGTGFRPLENLQDFEHKLENNVSSILFVTDGSLRDEDDIRGADLGTPLNWKLSDVDFSVVTAGQCSFWKNKAKAKDCAVISKKNRKIAFKDMLFKLEVE